MTPTYSHNIVPRMKDCLERQIDWFQSLKTELTTLLDFMTTTEEIEEKELAEITNKMEKAANQSRTLEEEFHALKREWDASESILPDERENIRALGNRAQALSVELSTLYTQNSELARQVATSQRIEMATMRRLSASLHKYRSDDDHDPVIDQNA